MESETRIQEILIVSESRFSQQKLCERKTGAGGIFFSDAEQFERVCWSGLLFEILPEVVGHCFDQKENYIWEVMPAGHFIRICLGPLPLFPCNETCLDPYFFLPTISLN